MTIVKRMTPMLAVLVLAAGVIATTPQKAEARRGGGLAIGIAAAVIGGVILHQALRNRYKRRVYYYRPRRVYYGSFYAPYYRPVRVYRYRSYRVRRVYRPRVIRRINRSCRYDRFGRRLCR